MISIIYLAYSCYRLIRRRWCKLPFLPAIFQKKKDVLYAKVPIKVPFHLPTSWHFRGSLAFVMVIVWEKNAAKNPPLPFPHYLVLLLVVGLILIGRFVDNLRCEKLDLYCQVSFNGRVSSFNYFLTTAISILAPFCYLHHWYWQL